ncbi:hypothetical protein I5907_13165 [Panacibacter sp. DH6]|uniref:Uncharacterized protein n=1 Tax=Panacibacter microcysteis TaxID=2793269 RepID=A0A931GYQ2_9BACT|nr:hypothetical protein [Panacibacter microcysteis]MBG9377187.1 hypothetical protein [Panacibacter microcysteis]
MQPQQILEKTKKIFEAINAAQSIQQLDNIYAQNDLPRFYPANKYPRLHFSLNEDDISGIDERILNDDGSIAEEASKHIQDPLAKILYAVLWKNGDLQKIKHVAQGIKGSNTLEAVDEAVVFKQFGKHLANKQEEPIIDQHVLRAFSIYQATDVTRVNKILRQTNFNDWKLVQEYKECFKTLNSKKEHIEGWRSKVDQLLFSLGKSIKANRNGQPAF